MARKIEVVIVGDSRSLQGALGKATQRSNVFGKALKYLAIAGAGAVVVGLHQSVKAALAAEASQARLQQSFKNSHLSLKTYARGLDATEKASRRLGFADNDVRDSLGSLLTATSSYKRSLSLLTVAQNIARFKGVSLTDATKMLTTAMTGSQRAVKQLGIIVMPVTAHVDALKKAHDALTKAQKAETDATYKQQLVHAKYLDKLATGNAVIAAATAKTHGFADAFGKTAAGNIQKFQAEFEHLKAELGRGLLPILTAGTTKLTGFVSSIETHLPEIRAQFGGLANIVGTAGKALLSFGGSRAGQAGLAGLATTFVGSGLVGEVHNFVGLLKTMNPEMIALGIAAGIAGGVLYSIMTSTSGLTRELLKAKSAVDELKNALNQSVQAGQNLKVAHHQLTGAEIAHAVAVKATAAALKSYGQHSLQYRSALNNERQAADSVVQGQINLKNAHQGVRQVADKVTHASKAQAEAIQALHDKGNRLITTYNLMQRESKDFQSSFRTKTVNEYANAIYALTRRMGGTKAEAEAARRKTVALNAELGHLPTLKQIRVRFRVEGLGLVKTAIDSIAHSVAVAVNVTARKKKAAGGVIEGGIQGQDSVPILAMPGEVIFNPRDPRRGEEALAALGFQRFARGGKVKHRAPHLPGSIREAEARAAGTAGLGDDIAAKTREEHWIESELGRHDLTRSEREGLRVKRIRVRNSLRSLKRRQAKAANRRQKDYSTLPASIQLRIARARNEHDNAKLLAALKAGESWLKTQLRRHGLTDAQKTAIYDALTSIEDEIASLQDAGAADTSGDLQAQLDQSRAQTAAANLRANLDEAFMATGAYASGGGAGRGGGHTIIFQHLIPDAEQIRRATGHIVGGLGNQGFRPATNHHLGV